MYEDFHFSRRDVLSCNWGSMIPDIWRLPRQRVLTLYSVEAERRGKLGSFVLALKRKRPNQRSPYEVGKANCLLIAYEGGPPSYIHISTDITVRCHGSVILSGTTRHGRVRRYLARQGMVECDTISHDNAWHSKALSCTTRHGRVRRYLARQSRVEYDTILHDKAW
ncbi:hypothetical protein J6590_024977 [Homalodisca vitripennis]|nr:hypothetical protein J6590_024977 [Homalodisca vitripennis]